MAYSYLQKIILLTILYCAPAFNAEHEKKVLTCSPSRTTSATVDTLLELTYSPLHKAVYYGNSNEVHLLLEKKAAINTQNHLNETPLHTAVWNSQHIQVPIRNTIVQKLVSKKADINACALSCGTPLHCAIARGDQALAKILLKHKADINACNHTKETPLHFSINEHCNNKKLMIQFVKLLVTHNADVHAKMPCPCDDWWCTQEFTPLELASQNGACQEILTLLKLNQ